MAQFNPGFEKKHEETYLASRPAMSPDPIARPPAKQYSNTIANFGNIFLGAVDAVDKIYQHQIQKDMTAQVDAVRDQAIGLGFTQADPANEPIPPDLERQLGRASRLASAHKAGKMSEKHYVAQLENISRQMRSRFPGHREHVDRVMSGLVGFTPANVLAKMSTASAGGGGAGANRRFQLERRAAELGLTEMISNKEQFTDDDFLQAIANTSRVKLDGEKAEAELRRLKAAGEYTDNIASQYHERQILKTNAVADEPTIILYNKMRSQLMSNKEQGITDPELEKRVMAEGIRLNDARLNRSLEYYNRPDVIDSMNPADRSKAIERVQQESAWRRELLTAGNYSIFDIVPTSTKSIADDDDHFYILADPTGNIRHGAAIKRTMGPAYLEQWLGVSKNLLENAERDLAQSFALRVHEAQTPPSLREHSKEISRTSQVKNPTRVLQAGSNTMINHIGNKQLPAQSRAKAAESLFGPENLNFMAELPDQETRIKWFNDLIQPEVAAGMLDLRKAGYNELYTNYVNWRQHTFNGLFSREMNDAQSIVVDRQSMNLSLDEEGRFVLEAPGRAPGLRVGSWENLAAWWTDAESSIRRLNAAIDALRPAWEVEGRDPLQEVQRTIQMSGVNLSAEKAASFPETVYGAVADAMREFQTRLRDAAKESGQMMRLEGGSDGERVFTPQDDEWWTNLRGIMEQQINVPSSGRVSDNIITREGGVGFELGEPLNLPDALASFSPELANNLGLQALQRMEREGVVPAGTIEDLLRQFEENVTRTISPSM